MKLDLLSVVYHQELEILKTQGRSIDLRFSQEVLDTIYIIINDDETKKEEICSEWWGKHSSKITIIHRSELGYVPTPYLRGWFTQQICKMLGVANSKSDWCIILDAKTWFMRDYTVELCFKRGKAKIENGKNYSPFWNDGVNYIKTFLNFDNLIWLSPGGVPFFAKPYIMQDTISKIENVSQQNFISWFEKNCQFPSKVNPTTNGITEFVCYNAYISTVPNLFDETYANEQNFSIFNITDYEVEAGKFDGWFQKLRLSNPFTASIHPRAIPLLKDEQLSLWNAYLKERGL